MPGLGLSLSLGARNPSLGGEQVIWKVAIFGAGTESSNGEYVWDGVTFADGKRYYSKGQWDFIQWSEFDGFWFIYDDLFGGNSYSSLDLINWSPNEAGSQAPSSALSYSQSSFISSITLQSNNETYPVAETPYTRSSGGTSTFYSTENEIGIPSMYWDSESSPPRWNVTNGDETQFASLDLFEWTVNTGISGEAPFPTVTAMAYSA